MTDYEILPACKGCSHPRELRRNPLGEDFLACEDCLAEWEYENQPALDWEFQMERADFMRDAARDSTYD